MTTLESLEPLLAELPIFQGLKPSHLALIAGCASNVRFDPDMIIARQGAPAETCWIVRHGRVALEIHSPERGAVTIATVGDNEVVGWSWLVPPHQWRFDAHVLTATRAIALDGRCLRGKLDTDYELGYEVMRRFTPLIAQRLEATSLQLLDVYGTNV